MLDARISQDGLLFNDTVHCAPLHPNRLFAARERLGLHPPPADASRARNTSRFSGLFFEIPLDRISTHRLLWYRWETETGKQPLLFVHIPHVLVAGPIDAHRLGVIRWDERPPDRHAMLGDVVE